MTVCSVKRESPDSTSSFATPLKKRVKFNLTLNLDNECSSSETSSSSSTSVSSFRPYVGQYDDYLLPITPGGKPQVTLTPKMYFSQI